MKKLLLKPVLYCILPALVFVVIAGSIARADTSTSAGSSDAQATDQAQSTTLDDRTALRKSTYSVNLTIAAQKGLAAKCGAAQSGLKNVQTKDSAAAKARLDIYSELTTRLNNTIDNLKVQNTDNTALKTAAGKFDSAVTQYTDDVSKYKTTLDDAVSIDCRADPTGFEAALLDARALRVQLAKDADAIKTAGVDVSDNLAKVKEALAKGGAN
jgi:hypothetical protein